MTTMAASWRKPLDVTLPASPAAADPESEVLRLLGDHGSSLYRFCRMTLGGADEADDVVQETFLKLLQHLRGGGDRANLRSWLFTVAANACRDRLRSRRRWLPWRPELDHRTVEAAEDTQTCAWRATRRAGCRRATCCCSRSARKGSRTATSALPPRIQERSVGRLLARAVDRWKRRVDEAQRLRKE